jgi:hypothetical protein
MRRCTTARWAQLSCAGDILRQLLIHLKQNGGNVLLQTTAR